MLVTKVIKDKIISICLSSEEFALWKDYATKHEYKSLSSFIRACVTKEIYK